MRDTKKRVTSWLPDNMFRRLEAEASAQHRSLASMILIIVEKYFEGVRT